LTLSSDFGTSEETFFGQKLKEVDEAATLAYHQSIATDAEVDPLDHVLGPHAQFLSL